MKRYLIFISLCIFILMNISTSYAFADNHSNLYDIKKGDTLWSIANRYGTTVSDLKLSNGLISDTIRVGQRLFVPMAYEVTKGDTLWSLSRKYNSTVDAIKEANGLLSNVIYIGQNLKIPPKKLNMQGQYILLTRDEFKNWLFNNQFSRKIHLIQEHHTWAPSYKHFNGLNHFSLLKGMENFHVNDMGWKNIAQNITTFPDGTIAISRPFDMAPDGSMGPKAHANGIAIENVGNFDIGFDQMTKEHRETILYLNALLCIKFGLTPSIDTITYHHWWDMRTGERVLDNSEGHSVKTCPGTGFFGGNSTTAAKTHFYPLVKRKMEEILSTLRD